jgi:hypothetical protein
MEQTSSVDAKSQGRKRKCDAEDMSPTSPTKKRDMRVRPSKKNTLFATPEEAIESIQHEEDDIYGFFATMKASFLAAVRAFVPYIEALLGHKMLYKFKRGKDGAYVGVYHEVTKKLVMSITDSDDIVIETDGRIMNFCLYAPYLMAYESSVGLDEKSLNVESIYVHAEDPEERGFEDLTEEHIKSVIRRGTL